MAQYTPNYGLHQWEAGDSFLRTDFNEDHARIDAALGRTARSAEASAYNLYNLMLQNYYEGKYTGYKKALIFDGFADTAGVARAEPGRVGQHRRTPGGGGAGRCGGHYAGVQGRGRGDQLQRQ